MASKDPDAIGIPGAPLHFSPDLEKSMTHDTRELNDIFNNARSATEKEHKMTLWQGIKLYPKAVAWSVLISTCICMEGYDICLLSSFCEYIRDVDSSRGRWGLIMLDRCIPPVQ